MAKKKDKEPVIETVEKEEIEIKEAEKPVKAEDDSYDKFVARTLMAINKMQNPAKAKRLANRLLRKRK